MIKNIYDFVNTGINNAKSLCNEKKYDKAMYELDLCAGAIMFALDIKIINIDEYFNLCEKKNNIFQYVLDQKYNEEEE